MRLTAFIPLLLFIGVCSGQWWNYIPQPIPKYRSCPTASSPSRAGSPLNPFETYVPPGLITNIQKLFPESTVVKPALIANKDIYYNMECDNVKMNVTFLYEGAGYQNLFGFFTFQFRTDGNLTKIQVMNQTIIFPDVEAPNCLNSGTNSTTVQFGPFVKGTKIGFYIISNGFNSPYSSNIYRSIHNPSWNFTNPDGSPHMAIVTDTTYNRTVIGFEDLPGLGDKDYNDVMFSLEFSPNCVDQSSFAKTNGGNVLNCDPNTPVITNSVSYLGFEYAVIDNAVPNSFAQDCQSGGIVGRGIYVPSGWSIAPNGTSTISSLLCNLWGTQCLILSDGNCYLNNGTVLLRNAITFLQNVNSTQTCFAPSSCSTPARIMIRRPTTFNFTVPFCQNPTLIQPITNYVTLVDYRYATIDNVWPQSTNTSGLNGWYRIPAGWTAASNSTNFLKALETVPWGASCVVGEDGKGFVPLTLAPCSVPLQTATTPNGQFIYYIPPQYGDVKLLISQPYKKAAACSS